MQYCSQYNPHAGNTTPCSGKVHKLTVDRVDHWVAPRPIDVCDTHMTSFIELGRQEKHKFTILGDDIIGVITLPESKEGRKPSTGERES